MPRPGSLRFGGLPGRLLCPAGPAPRRTLALPYPKAVRLVHGGTLVTSRGGGAS